MADSTPLPHVDQLHVAYLGPPASFSHQAAQEAFLGNNNNNTTTSPSTNISLYPLASFSALLAAIQTSNPNTSKPDESAGSSAPQIVYDYALLPVENSTNGDVDQVLDLLIKCGPDSISPSYPDIEVVAEHYLTVHHCLFVHRTALATISGSSSTTTDDSETLTQTLEQLKVTTLFTHPQVWGQCARFLARHFSSSVDRVDTSSTSAAAGIVAKTSTSGTNSTTPPVVAAISSSLAGQINDLACLAANIEDDPGRNTTRFLIIRNRNGARPSLPARLHVGTRAGVGVVNEGKFYKSMLTFTVPHTQPGSLASTLAVFERHGFNLTAITTRPSRERNWHYVFFVECEEQRLHREDDARLRAMVDDLARFTERICFLGSWIDMLRHG